jgi:hypothetical protein
MHPEHGPWCQAQCQGYLFRPAPTPGNRRYRQPARSVRWPGFLKHLDRQPAVSEAVVICPLMFYPTLKGLVYRPQFLGLRGRFVLRRWPWRVTPSSQSYASYCTSSEHPGSGCLARWGRPLARSGSSGRIPRPKALQGCRRTARFRDPLQAFRAGDTGQFRHSSGTGAGRL